MRKASQIRFHLIVNIWGAEWRGKPCWGKKDMLTTPTAVYIYFCRRCFVHVFSSQNLRNSLIVKPRVQLSYGAVVHRTFHFQTELPPQFVCMCMCSKLYVLLMALVMRRSKWCSGFDRNLFVMNPSGCSALGNALILIGADGWTKGPFERTICDAVNLCFENSWFHRLCHYIDFCGS